MDYVEELIYYFEGNDKEFDEYEANLFLNDISGATLSTEEIDNIINEFRKLIKIRGIIKKIRKVVYYGK